MPGEVKRCPFCGAKAVEMCGIDDYWVECSDYDMCGARGPWRYNSRAALRAWNAKNKRRDNPCPKK